MYTMAFFVKPKIRNVVCTASLEQRINMTRLAGLACGIYDEAIYGGRCGYVKTPEMDGRVTIFPSGKMISVGGRTISKAIGQLNHAKFYLVQEKMAHDVKIVPVIRNIVATVELDHKISVDVLSSKIPGAIYDPETFPGMIIKGVNNCSFLVFASGKIVIAGARSSDELNTSSFDMIQRLNDLLK